MSIPTGLAVLILSRECSCKLAQALNNSFYQSPVRPNRITIIPALLQKEEGYFFGRRPDASRRLGHHEAATTVVPIYLALSSLGSFRLCAGAKVQAYASAPQLFCFKWLKSSGLGRIPKP